MLAVVYQLSVHILGFLYECDTSLVGEGAKGYNDLSVSRLFRLYRIHTGSKARWGLACFTDIHARGSWDITLVRIYTYICFVPRSSLSIRVTPVRSARASSAGVKLLLGNTYTVIFQTVPDGS